MKKYKVELNETGYEFISKRIIGAVITCSKIELDSENKNVVYADGLKIEFLIR